MPLQWHHRKRPCSRTGSRGTRCGGRRRGWRDRRGSGNRHTCPFPKRERGEGGRKYKVDNGELGLVLGVVASRNSHNDIVGNSHRKNGVTKLGIEGSAERGIPVIVDVLTNEVDSSRSTNVEIGFGTKGLNEASLQLLVASLGDFQIGGLIDLIQAMRGEK